MCAGIGRAKLPTYDSQLVTRARPSPLCITAVEVCVGSTDGDKSATEAVQRETS